MMGEIDVLHSQMQLQAQQLAKQQADAAAAEQARASAAAEQTAAAAARANYQVRHCPHPFPRRAYPVCHLGVTGAKPSSRA